MVKVDVVRRKVTGALSRLSRAESILARPAEVFLADEDAKDLASFHLFLAIQECIDIASHFMADADMPRTATGKILHRTLRDRLAIEGAGG